ncbi:MAG: MerR family transcriptional regulator [Candidatus Omnitrophica bacterium]|nr:MerR family transcriptional regulator [Candidatus Omnitrophota bacterium]
MHRLNDQRFGTVKALEKIGISSERLRYWERSGIVSPKYIKSGTRKFRRYSMKDIERAIFIKILVNDKGYSLQGAIRKVNNRKDLVTDKNCRKD